MNREAGIAAHAALLSADEHRRKTAAGETDHLHLYKVGSDTPVLDLRITRVKHLNATTALYTQPRSL